MKIMTTELVTVDWQSVNDCHPIPWKQVLATDLEDQRIAYWSGKFWIEAYSEHEIDSYITHWMELPELPEDES